MLIRFNITNFRSFDAETEFNMLAAKSLKQHKEHIYQIKANLNVLKSSAIYGANGAGKSNLIKAIDNLRNIVKDGCVPTNISKNKYRLKEENKNKPVVHEIEFSREKKVYTYGICFDDNIVLEEWLYVTGNNNPKLVFERKYSKEKKHSVITVADKYIQTEKFKMLISLMEENLLKKDETLISKNDNLKIREIADILDWFNNKLKIVYPSYRAKSFIGNLHSSKKLKKFSEDLLKTFDVGIDSFEFKTEDLDNFLNREGFLEEEEIEELKSGLDKGHIYEFSFLDFSVVVVKEKNSYLAKHLNTTHLVNKKQVSFDIEEESDGTQRLIDFIPLFEDLLNQECTYVIDEIDRSLHPSILHVLIEKIMNDNTTKGQLIFTTHESSLLSCKIFRPDEIWFAEKDRDTQSTQLYTLNEFKPRHDLDIEKGYLNGRFGAIPFLSKLEDLNWLENGI